MNLIEQMNVLKGLDDAMLQREVAAPSGSVPPYLVLTEINRRKDMRQRYEGELARRKPQTTVAQDLLTAGGPMAMPSAVRPAPMGSDSGIAALASSGGVPTPSFADGGIVDLAGIRQRYNDELTDLGDDRDRARAFALLAASAGMLGGGSSNTLKNVGSGVAAGIDAYSTGLNAVDSRETGLLKSLADLDLAAQDEAYRQRELEFRQAQEGRLNQPSYAQTPIFLYDNQDPPQAHLAQPSTGGGYLIDGKTYPGIPPGWSVTNRPTALEVKDLGTNLATVNTNLGPNAGEVTTVAPIDVSGKAFDEKLGTDLGAQIGEARTAATDAQLSLAASEEALKLLDDGMITGFGADFRVGMGKALQQVGINLAEDEIANTEAFVATRALEVGRLIKLFGAGTGLSDADREYATKAAAGSVNMNEESIRRIIDINNRAARNVIDKYNTLAAPLAGRGSIPTVIIPGTQAAPTAAAPVQITDDAGYDALPSGAEFIDPNGVRRKKP